MCLPAAEAFAFSSPSGRLGELSHSIKAWYWLSFYHVIERFFPLSQYSLFNVVYSTIMYKKTYIYVNEKYIYEAPKNGQTVVSAAQRQSVRWATT